ncbi:hypothetical protein [Pseudaquidulcibacter saccharophilus]|uniref:hypothetical protein n=1 Tax=Pseudaquidulcibacter saccharophilus TaxID=2831900 RepID=UPI001EFF00B8|nr:hypothetical protein [Pseudaquidulcibacter saccharophilus]
MSDGFFDFGNIGGKARAIAFAESPFDENGFPKPWVLAITVFGHLLLLVTLINIEPMIIKKDNVVYGVDIVKLPPIEKQQEPPVETQKTLQENKPVPQQELPPIAQQTIPEPEQQQAPQIVPQEQVPEEVKQEIVQPAKVQLSPQQIQMQKVQKLKAPNIDKIEEQEEINLATVPNLNIQVPQLNKLQNRDVDVKRPINAQKLDAPNNIKTANPNINRPANDLKINVDELNRNYEEQQRQADMARQKALDDQKQKQDAIRQSANAPKANGGELAPPSGSSSGVTAIGGGGAPARGGASGGVLPNAPKSYGGRNVFEENENGSLLARMGRTADCASLNRQRDEKCPNWEPLDGHLGGKIAPKVQPQYKAPPTHVDPLPVCPPGTPKSNFGLSCLPAKN